MSCLCKRSIFERGKGFAVDIPIEFLYALEGEPMDYDVVWGFDDKAGKPCIKFEKRGKDKK